MKIFLDDMRAIPDRYEGARDFNEFVSIMKNNKGNIDTISLDHDLGTIKTGYDACKWIIENEFFDGLKTVIIHTANPVGGKNMEQLLDRYLPKDIEIYRMTLSKELEKVKRNF